MYNSSVWDRKIDKLENRRAKVYLNNGSVIIGKAGNCCDASTDDISNRDGVLFDTDNGDGLVLVDDDIEKIEFLD